MRKLQEAIPELLGAPEIPTAVAVSPLMNRQLGGATDGAVAPPAAPVDLSGKTLLIVDDDRINLRILGGILKREAYRILEAATAEQAMDKLVAAAKSK